IINNALIHTAKGEKAFVNLSVENDRAMLTVENTGIHIDEVEFEKIFNPFYRIEKSRSRSTGGSGLGLYIVKVILEAHEVDYKINNSELGVCFKIIFNRGN
ncbi:sensor histidine kinase, partial [Clostridium perfringens]|uniref:ATP-binding protein n=1 Tax=Clostridium perfringens TaxID=1502 RepID=UPI002AC41FD4